MVTESHYNLTNKLWLEKLLTKTKDKISYKFFDKQYIHFDSKIKANSDAKLIEFLENFLYLKLNRNKVATHAFYPFIQYQKPKIKYRYNSAGTKRKLYKSKSDNPKQKDNRTIMYCAHTDKLIYQYYAILLEQIYESKLMEAGLANSVLAYRSIKKIDKHGKNNVDFGFEAFNIIKNYVINNGCVVATAFDIKGFFDNISHKELKNSWKMIIGTEFIPSDQYNIYKSVTKYSYIDKLKLYKLLKLSSRKKIAKYLAENKSKITLTPNLFRQLKSEIRKAEEYIQIEKGDTFLKGKKTNQYILIKNNQDKGIPQGSPISGILANIYLFEFDKAINDFITSINGTYFRYSDDILLITEPRYAKISEEYLTNQLTKHKYYDYKTKSYQSYLILSKNKTERKLFGLNKHEIVCNDLNSEYLIDTVIDLKSNSKLQYLGLEFNGKDIYLRSSSISKHYSKVRLRLRKVIQKVINTNSKLLLKGLYNKNTHFGKAGFYEYKRNIYKTTKSNKINKQLRKHMLNFHKILEIEKNTVLNQKKTKLP